MCIIPFNVKGSRPPIFFVYERFEYENLIAEMGEDQPAYVLTFEGVFDKSANLKFTDVAREFISRMRTVQPRGPYYLGGVCIGGRIAYAIAHELYKQGETVGVLAVFDSPAPGFRSSVKKMPFLLKLRVLRLDDWALEWEILKRLDFKGKISIILETLKLDSTRYFWRIKWRLTKLLYRARGRSVPAERRDPFQLMRKTMGDHCPPEPYPGTVTLFRPTDRPKGPLRTAEFGWEKMPIGGLELLEVPGRHMEMLRRPNVSILARQLSECLRKAHAKKPAAREDLVEVGKS